MRSREYKKMILMEFKNIFNKKFNKKISFYLSSYKAPSFLKQFINSGGNKFRSALSYLLSEKKEEGIVIGSAAEIAWAGIIILDDIGDLSETRRGKTSIWKKYGLLKSSHSALMAFQIAEFILEDNQLYDSLYLFRKASLKTVIAQIEQNNFNISTSSNQVLNNYLWKTALDRWSIEATIRRHHYLSKLEKSALIIFNQLLSVAAQIRNDLDDFQKGDDYETSFKDIRSKCVNYPLALFFERSSKKDIKYFLKKYWGSNDLKAGDKKKIIVLLEKYKAISDAEKRLKLLLEESLKCLKSVKNEKFKKILSEWIKIF